MEAATNVNNVVDPVHKIRDRVLRYYPENAIKHLQDNITKSQLHLCHISKKFLGKEVAHPFPENREAFHYLVL